VPPRREKGAGLKAEEYLLHLMKTDTAWCHRVAEATTELLFTDADCRAVAECLISCGSGEHAEREVLAEGLTEPQKDLLSGIIIKDDQVLAEDPAQIYDDCLKAVEKERLKIRYVQLQDLIRQAEAADDSEQRAAWQRESIEVLMKIKKPN
jgi:hypothetical protein